MGSFTDLEVWKKSRILRNNISNLVKSFPSEQKYRLTDQIIRSSRSIGNNIAEGHGRFLINARGSSTETIDHLVIALDENYIDNDIFNQFKEDCEECSKMINGYISYLRNQSTVKQA